MGLWKRLRLTRQPDGTSPWWGIAILLVGVVLVLLGWLWEGTWEDVFIEVGAAAGVGGIVLLFKPRLMRQVKEQATEAGAAVAEDIASTKAEAIEQRLVKLESISDIQARERDRLQEETERVIAAVDADASVPNLIDLLEQASQQSLFAESFFIKTSEVLGQPLFQVSHGIYTVDPEVIRMLSWDILAEVESYTGARTYESIEEPGVRWLDNVDFAEFVREVYSVFTRANLPSDSLSLENSILHLQESHRLMVEARQAPEGSSTRLNGKLVLLINNEWALTDAGLEGVLSNHLFPWMWSGMGCFISFGDDSLCPSGWSGGPLAGSQILCPEDQP